MTGRWGLSVAMAGVATLSAVAQDRVAYISSVQLEPGMAAVEGTTADCNGDGRVDLILVLRRADRNYERTVRVHFAQPQKPWFRDVHDAELPLPVDAVGIAIGDVHSAPGDEIIVLGARGAICWRPTVTGRDAFSKLIDVDLLWQVPDPEDVLLWRRGLEDLDGDGWVDLILPEPGGYAIARQQRTEAGATFDPPMRLRLPPRGRSTAQDGDGMRAGGSSSRGLSISFSGGSEPSGPMVAVDERVPVPWVADWDADGDRDVLVLTDSDLLVWLQDDKGLFGAAPSWTLPLPVVEDRKRRFDVTHAGHAADLDGDGRVDCVMFAGDYRSDDVRTQVLVFVQKDGVLFGPKGIPDQLLVLGGFAGETQFADVDGDGRTDLVVGAVRIDFLEAMSASATETIEAELYVYRNQGGKFSRQPDVTIPVTVQAQGSGSSFRRLEARFFGDVTGDGTRELLLRGQPGRVQVLLTLVRRGVLTIPQRPLWELGIHEEAELRTCPRPQGSPDLLILEPAKVLHVRFR